MKLVENGLFYDTERILDGITFAQVFIKMSQRTSIVMALNLINPYSSVILSLSLCDPVIQWNDMMIKRVAI